MFISIAKVRILFESAKQFGDFLHSVFTLAIDSFQAACWGDKGQVMSHIRVQGSRFRAARLLVSRFKIQVSSFRAARLLVSRFKIQVSSFRAARLLVSYF